VQHEENGMSCGVRYEFSIINMPKAAKLIDQDVELLGTPHDAEEAGPADLRRPADEDYDPTITARGRQRPAKD